MSDEHKPIPELDSIIAGSEQEFKKKHHIAGKTEDWLGKNFKQYDVVKKLGQGAMAEVFQIYHPGLSKHFALKLTGSSLDKVGTLSDQDSKRFLREARVSAKLKHPNIVSVIDNGTKDGREYLVMDYVEGMTLDDYIAKKKPSFNACLKIIAKIADALSHAHKQAIIHRDLKPGNVMMEGDEPMLMDFGLAKPVDVDTSFTQMGTVLGTPSYMAPEQAQGRIDEIDARSDVYGLGAILYYMLTGKAPFERKVVMATLMAVVREDVVPPSGHNADVPDEVEALCLKALQKNPQNRFQSTDEMAMHIHAYLNPQGAQAAAVNRATMVQKTGDTVIGKEQSATVAPGKRVKDSGALAKYVVKKELAKGGMGVVYVAEDPKLQRTVAIKILHSRQHATDKENARFIKEARMAAKLSHGRIVTVYEVGECEEGYFIAMEYFQAKDLEQLIKAREKFFQQDIKYSCGVAIKILEGMQHAHENNVLHRDLKPANILVRDKDLKITDFGLATDTNATASGKKIFMGTPMYCSPEQMKCLPLDPRADLYSIGIILYEMLTGTVPFTGKSFDQLAAKISKRPPKPPTKINSKIPRDLENIILTALSKNKEDRYADANDFKLDLQRFLLGKPIYAKPPSALAQISRTLQSSKMGIIAAVAIIAIFWMVSSFMASSAATKQRQDELDGKIDQVNKWLEEANEYKQKGNFFEAIKLAQNAKKVISSEEFQVLADEFVPFIPEVDEFLEPTVSLRDIRLKRALKDLKKLRTENRWAKIRKEVMKVKLLDAENSYVKELETFLNSDHLELVLSVTPRDAEYRVYGISDSKIILFDKVLHSGKVDSPIDLTQDKWYMLEVVKENYFTVRKFLFAGRESKSVYVSINMVSQGDYPNYRNMTYIPSAKVALGPKRPLPRRKKVRFPLGTSSRQINHFLIDRYEVSNKEYRQYLVETGKVKQPSYIPKTWKKGKIPRKRENHPVVGISWAHALEYAEHYGKDLPTSAQMELAALGTDGRRYPWGDLSAVTDNGKLSYKKEFIYLTQPRVYTTVAVDTVNKDVSPFGIHHLGGNVREWTKTDGKIRIKGRGVVEFYVTRGAHFQKNCFETDQYPLWAYKGKDYSPYVGFRCVKNLAGGK
ncbi:bifunctional serine/threonine-protein kinase/formylglycine-generating enzyme family protein [Candidatus Uabimicrobium amorphum]|uniref:non-specific serine/threonine protein kinase n=1 Tax=Uabimicrobium amorphum TaxID=2596890 RepID=A0A5S9F7A9_UABAM|nr:bifunctional serine/threonine-protein kinase/formylglycine-generating enzyme family protein [Candidatus Uabimicrobium amorphum]BBM87519.1 protein kinase [Candidatus Uabimicrobium amorphum]